jgi:anaerobic nitric oxide reductase transcription regulator
MMLATFPAHIEEAIRAAVLNLTASLSARERFHRFLDLFSEVTGNKASALLRYQEGVLVPVAIRGLSAEVMGRSFRPADHPRLATIIATREPVRFAVDDPRPDPYDGLLEDDPGRKIAVHACLGCGLYSEDTLLGVLSADAMEANAFDAVDDYVFRVFAAIATVALRHEAYIFTLETLARHRGQVAAELVTEALERSQPMLGRSSVMQMLSREMNIVAPSDLTVLLMGETGVGKEVLARTLHSLSNRAGQSLVHVNCAALPESLAESELFGHAKGAFTGAVSERMGKFELAAGGTLFLDEVGELPLNVQAKLLRAVQFGEIQRVGSDRELRVDVRIIAATNRLLAEEVKVGRFRADLYHRLSVYPLHVPPLRDRPEDIPMLAEHFLETSRVRLGLRQLSMEPATLRALLDYDWPGNVRELEHVILRGALRAGSRSEPVVLCPADLDGVAARVTRELPRFSGTTLAVATADFQGQCIRHRLIEHQGNWSETARSLGLDRSNLHRLARRLGIK